MGLRHDEPAIKGAAYRELVGWAERHRDPAVLRAVVANLPPEDRERFDVGAPALGILPSVWYPARVVYLMLEAAVGHLPHDELVACAREATAEAAPRLVRGIYGALFRSLATPERYARHIGRAWRQLHSTGERALVITAPGQATSTIARWPAHHPIMCLVTLETMASVFRLMKREDVRVVRVACVADGAAECTAKLTWRA